MTDQRREALIRALPYARRYARALTGSQPRGDALVAASLREMLEAQGAERDAREALYASVTRQHDADTPGDAEPGLSQRQRQLLLLTSLEELPTDRAAGVVGLDPNTAMRSLAEARERLRAAAATDVLIIEDEPIIALDLTRLVREQGHRVAAVAATRDEAIAAAREKRPGLVLADIRLADGSSGMEAASEILKSFDIPVIFITAFPEHLLTGERPEPAFLITKPFREEAVKALVGQALFFHGAPAEAQPA